MPTMDELLTMLKEAIVTLAMFFYLYIQAIVFAILPSSFRAKDVSGDTVLVTGAGSGIGRLMTLKFAKLGCRMVLWDINKESIDSVAEEVKLLGAKVYTYAIDLSVREEIYKVADKVKKEVGAVDILINNAGIVTGKKFLDCPDSLIQKTMEVNTMSHFWTVKSFLPAMLERDHGHVVTIASAAGLTAVSGLGDYCASKFAAVGFDEALRLELSTMNKKGVHTTVICPYYINTGMFEGAKTRIITLVDVARNPLDRLLQYESKALKESFPENDVRFWFPRVLPIVEPEYAANKIVAAVLCNQHMLCFPRFCYVVYGLKGFLPTKVQTLLANFFGVNSLLDTFVGRQQKQD